MSELFAVIDAARDEALYNLIHDEPTPDCLFRTEVRSPVGRNSPYLLEVDPASPLMKAWSARGRGQNWGLFVRSPLPRERLLQRLRTFNMAQLPDGRTVLFRWWDPRVFRVYLPTCEGQELSPWFNGVEEYLCENEEGDGVQSYRWNAAAWALQTRPATFPAIA